MKSRWLHLLITIFVIFSYMQFEYVRYCMECDAGYQEYSYCLLYTSDAADEEDSGDFCGCQIIKKKKREKKKSLLVLIHI